MVDFTEVRPTVAKLAGADTSGMELDGQIIFDADGNVLDNRDIAYNWYSRLMANDPTTFTEFAQEDQYNVVAHNLVTLHDRLKKFTVLSANDIPVRMDSHEAGIYCQAVLELLGEAKCVAFKKNEIQPHAPTVM